MQRRKTLIPLIVTLLAIAVPAGAIDPFRPSGGTERQDQPRAIRLTSTQQLDLSPYEGLGTWIDMYDADPWKYPELAVADLAQRGVQTIYLETANWHKPAGPLFKPTKIGRFIEAAHQNGIYVVAWYVPGFKNIYKDKKRIRAALDYVSPLQETFDSFALDIESTVINDYTKRVRRMTRLSAWLREKVGPDYAMGGIVPDVQSLFWGDFPYATVAAYFDVMMPMSYFTYRVSGRAAVKSYVTANFTEIRAEVGDPSLRIHNIGGIGGRSTRREARAYTNSVLNNGGIGGSYYDYPITAEREWEELYPLIGL